MSRNKHEDQESDAMMSENVSQDDSGLREGVVHRKSKGFYWVKPDDACMGCRILCRISNLLRKELVYSTADESSRNRRVDQVRKLRAVDPIAVGDKVHFHSGDGERGTITGILPRINKFSRRAAGRHAIEQVIVSNIDQVVPVFAAARPRPSWAMLDRYLADAEAADLQSLICITKQDTADRDEIDQVRAIYTGIGYPVVVTSIISGEGIRELKGRLKGKRSVLAGKSGVGKSSLINAMQPGQDLKTRSVLKGKIGKGRHTTTHLELYELGFGGNVIDTPGIRELGIWNEHGRRTDELFPEFRELRAGCGYPDCMHTSEPDCAIIDALEEGAIDEGRYESYLALIED
jgi:ribosome biogenesis GTPase